ncbi:MAG: SH3 domain-containing protein [Oscillospiraceae bacterium]|nr:SH3 domain-containing protein [Oscillospiraceae bacterium]
MRVKTIKNHPGEGDFPIFMAGTAVNRTGENCTHYLHWYPCDIDGHNTYVPECFVVDGKLARDYNPTELVASAGDILDVLEIVHAWLVARNQDGVIGWIPAEVVISA